jgi:hypothetical protein
MRRSRVFEGYNTTYTIARGLRHEHKKFLEDYDIRHFNGDLQ